MRLYEEYFADIDALNDDKITELRNYHEETRSLARYYYMNIPQDICEGIKEKAMDYIFREGFGTGSKTAGNIISGLAGLLFGKEEK